MPLACSDGTPPRSYTTTSCNDARQRLALSTPASGDTPGLPALSPLPARSGGGTRANDCNPKSGSTCQGGSS